MQYPDSPDEQTKFKVTLQSVLSLHIELYAEINQTIRIKFE